MVPDKHLYQIIVDYFMELRGGVDVSGTGQNQKDITNKKYINKAKVDRVASAKAKAAIRASLPGEMISHGKAQIADHGDLLCASQGLDDQGRNTSYVRVSACITSFASIDNLSKVYLGYL